MDPSKALVIVDAHTGYKLYTIEEAMSRKLNQWKGWKCSAGTDNLYVNPDGNLYAATCKIGGSLGNVYEGRFDLPSSWLICTKEFCLCGADMKLRKARSEDLVHKAYEAPPGSELEELANQDWVAPVHEAFQPGMRRKTIDWDLGRRCNYHCSYCHPAISNQYEGYRTWGSLKFAADGILANFVKNAPASWIFAGGEPTLNPSFMDLVLYLRERGDWIHTQSNGSRGGMYLSDLIEHSGLGLSFHFEFADPERFIESCAEVVARKQASEKARSQPFGIKIMVPPGMTGEAVRIFERIQGISGFPEQGQVGLSPLFRPLEVDRLMDYAPREMEAIIKHSG